MTSKRPGFYDVVVKRYDSETGARSLKFPDISICEKCAGVRYVYPGCFDGGEEGYVRGMKIDDPLLALQISLVRFGYMRSYMRPECVEIKACCTLHKGADKGVPARNAIKTDSASMYPLLCGCSGCGGQSGYYSGGKMVKDPWQAFRLALIQFGDKMCRMCDNYPPSKICDCEQRLGKLQRAVDRLPIVGDTGWSLNKRTSRPMRGIRDYDRSMVFGRDLSKDEMLDLREWLAKKDCPGWTGIMVRKHETGRYSFTTTWDSSD